jgi:3',5'-cyclic AMP phosphodiesterase CpdA
MKFIHISDLHFHRDKRDNKDALKALKNIKERYAEHYLLVTGDITDDGHEEQYEQAFDALKPFKKHIFVCPGNHDFGAVGFIYDRDRAELFDMRLAKPLAQHGTFAGDNQPVVNVVKDGDEKVLLIAIDTNLETEVPFDFACGEIGEKQLKALNAILSNPDNADLTTFLMFHHHPFMRNDPFMELQDAAALWPIVYKRLDVLLFGHRHVSEMWADKGGVQFVLASDNSPGKDYAREISVVQKEITVADVSIA